MTVRNYSSRSQQTTLSGALNSVDGSTTVVSGANLRGTVSEGFSGTFPVVIDPDTTLEEIVDITAISGNNLTITRGVDGSSGVAHSAGAIVRHMVIGRDLREANTHSEATTGHGATGAVVGTTNTQTLTNKTLTAPVITTPTITGAIFDDGSVVFEGATANAYETTLAVTDPTSDRTITLPDVTGTVVTTGDSGTVTSTMMANDTLVDADINTAANIAWTKIAPSSTVSATEVGYLDGVTSAIQTQIDSKLATATASSTYAPLASPALTGVPTAPTAAANTNTTQVATTEYVQSELTALLDGAPGALDTLNELAAAIADDANYSTTITTALGTKLPLAGGTMSGAIAMGTSKITGMGDPTANQDAATKYYVDNLTVAPSNLTGPITSVGSATSIASQTGTGTKFVVDTSPTLVTPVLGVATATSVNGTTIPTSKTLVVTTDKISALSATTSSELAGVISDETGSGALVFGTSPTIGTPTITSPTITGAVFNDGSVVFEGATANDFETTLAVTDPTADRTITFPNDTGTVALTSGVINNTLLTTTGDIIYASSANTPARLAAGTSGYVLTAAGAGVAPAWAAASSGSMTLLTTTALSGTSTTISGIIGGYRDLRIYGKDIVTTAGTAGLKLTWNGFTVGTYGTIIAAGAYTSPITSTRISNAAGIIDPETGRASLTTTGALQFIFNAREYTGTTGFRMVDGWIAPTYSEDYLTFAALNDTSSAAITSFTVTTTAGTASLTGSILIYGVL